MARDLDALLESLRKGLPTGGNITGIKVLSAGNSNETYLLEGVDAILKLMPSGVSLTEGYGILDQFQIQAVIGSYRTAPAVPPVRYLCLDSSVVGEPFYLMERVEGISFDEYADKTWFSVEDDHFRSGVCEQFVSAFASLSKLPALDAFGPIRTPADDCATWRGHAVAAGATSLVAIFDELIAKAPPLVGKPCPCHGDAKIANTIWKDGKLQAVLDWELASNGDPRTDLGYMCLWFQTPAEIEKMYGASSGVWAAQQIVAAWEAATERSASDISWFVASAAAKVAAITLYGAHLYSTNRTANDKMSAWANDEFKDFIIGNAAKFAAQV